MPRTLTEEQTLKLAKLLILMAIPREDRLDMLTTIETPETLRLFLRKLSTKNFQMTPEEVKKVYLETMMETT